MKRFLALTLLVGFAACQDQGLMDPDIQPQFAKPGPVIDNSNGAPSGKHYNLNIIGTSLKNPPMQGNNGHRIFVNLWSKGSPDKIMLCESGVEGGCAPDGGFAVLDANGTDGRAEFALPNPDPDCDGITEYSVYIRALGKPGNHAKMQTCYEDAVGTWCAVDLAGGVAQIEVGRANGGKSKFENVSKDLLYVDYCTEVDASGNCTDWAVSPLFGVDGTDYWWEYDNYGQRIVQMRFYEIPTEAWVGEEMYCPMVG